MSCYRPLQAWRSRERGLSGKLGITFSRALAYADLPLELPCGQCIGCRLERSRQWAMRITSEAQLFKENCFVTFTYDCDSLPRDGSLSKRHFQLFLKRLRKYFSGRRIRYFHCGEYGDDLGRPHYHAIIFGLDFHDKILHKTGKFGLYVSALCDRLWSHGFCYIGSVSFESASYVARYCMKKVTGEAAVAHYERTDLDTGQIYYLQPEYISMSLKPGIGADWFAKFSSDVYPSDSMIVNGREVRPPKFFDAKHDPVKMEKLKLLRIKKAIPFKSDQSPDRLKVREQVVTAQLNLKSRHKDI